MFGQDCNQLRQMYFDAWRKQQGGELMQPLEAMIAEVIVLHPEYHALLEQGEDALDKDFLPEMGETNPFMHMGMHIAIREQLATDRPDGIALAHKKLLLRLQDVHEVEHQIMEWSQYLQCVQQRANKK